MTDKWDDTFPNIVRANFPHIGMRKVKSVLAVLLGFFIWQAIRFFVPGLEVHPIFIYIYGLIEIRENSEKTVNFGKIRMKTTFVGLGVGLPFLAISQHLQAQLPRIWMQQGVELLLLLTGTMLTLIVAEKVQCKTFCGLAAAIFIILMVSYADGQQYLYCILRSFQTFIGVIIAWLINVRWFPYYGPQKTPPAEPPKPEQNSDKA